MAINGVITIMSASTVANGSTIYSDSYSAEYASGFSALLIILAGSSSVTISQQTSVGGTVWHDPVDKTGTALGVVATALTATASGVYVQFSPVVARFNRFKVVAAAASTVTLSVVQAEQGE